MFVQSNLNHNAKDVKRKLRTVGSKVVSNVCSSGKIFMHLLWNNFYCNHIAFFGVKLMSVNWFCVLLYFHKNLQFFLTYFLAI